MRLEKNARTGVGVSDFFCLQALLTALTSLISRWFARLASANKKKTFNAGDLGRLRRLARLARLGRFREISAVSAVSAVSKPFRLLGGWFGLLGVQTKLFNLDC